MTSFNTCAYLGCTRRIPYDPKEDITYPRYCPEHMKTIENRIGRYSFDDLYAYVGNRSLVTPADSVPKTIILRCPLCKLREEVPAAMLGTRTLCKTNGCTGMMLYHKDSGGCHVR